MDKMIKAIANKLVDISAEEYHYYQELEKQFGKEACVGLFQSTSDGKIISVMPSTTQPTASVLIFFFLNLMLNQRLRALDSSLLTLETLEKRLKFLEDRIK